MIADHTPDPEFLDHLEWELAASLRRQSAFNGTSSVWRFVRRPHWAVTLGLTLASCLIGGAGAYAAMHVADQRMAALHIARGEALLEIARIRREPIARHADRMAAMAQQGNATLIEMRAAETQLAQADAHVQVHALNLDETRLTSKPPNDALSAPLVNGRDFVTERLAARKNALQANLDLALNHADRMQQLQEASSVSSQEMLVARSQVENAERMIAQLDRRVELRAAFLADERSAAQVELEDMRQATQTNREMMLGQMKLLEAQRDRVAALYENGVVSNDELEAVTAELEALQAQLQLADLELDILEQKAREVQEK